MTSNINARYALHCEDGFWSNGSGPWKHAIPEVLLTVEEVNELHTRFPNTHIIDVVAYRHIMRIYFKGVELVIPADYSGCSTPEMRTEARKAGADALIAAGYDANAHII